LAPYTSSLISFQLFVFISFSFFLFQIPFQCNILPSVSLPFLSLLVEFFEFSSESGYYGSIYTTHFGLIEPPVSVQTVPVF